MSIELKNISKHFGAQKAVDEISFSLTKGEIVGFLGPNGAGKTTTMKMITGYLPATDGSIEVCGQRITPDAISIRSQIGYLPEHNPLYLDMYVREFLQFAAETQGVKNANARIAEMIEMTGLQVEQHKKIAALSKGYRQRVGLAQALIHDPEVLILDEPTTGLDPNQIQEIRKLIQLVGQEKTVLLSTHIMQEVQAICDRVIIINKGKIVADENTKKIQSDSKGKTYLVEFSKNPEIELLRRSFPAAKIEHLTSGKFKMLDSTEDDLRPAIFAFAMEHSCPLIGLEQEAESLEDIFQNLTSE